LYIGAIENVVFLGSEEQAGEGIVGGIGIGQ
jgi:hypothetical protein